MGTIGTNNDPDDMRITVMTGKWSGRAETTVRGSRSGRACGHVDGWLDAEP